jgi:hypothetical protein
MDILSRSAISSKYKDGTDNCGVVIIKLEQLIAAVQLHYMSNRDSLTSYICKASAREAEVIEGLKFLEKHAPHTLTDGTML